MGQFLGCNSLSTKVVINILGLVVDVDDAIRRRFVTILHLLSFSKWRHVL